MRQRRDHRATDAGAGHYGDSDGRVGGLDHTTHAVPGRAAVSRARPVVPRGSRVTVNPRRRGGLVGETGQVVGPDQRWFPHPHSVWVEFGNGLTILIAVTDLIIMPIDGSASVQCTTRSSSRSHPHGDR